MAGERESGSTRDSGLAVLVDGDAAPAWLRGNVGAVTAALSVVGYALVIATFQGWLPIYPEIGEAGVDLLGHAIAAVNVLATLSLAAGWYWIRRGDVRRHAAAMTSAFALILLFLLLYLPKVGGGGQQYLADAAPDAVALGYFAMLVIHVVLSVVAMPIVLYAFLSGATRAPAELRGGWHPRVGRVAAAAWIVSLVLGVGTYVVLNVFGSDFVPA